MTEGVRIVAVLFENDYGQPDRGRSYEYYNILLPLRSLYETILFDPAARERAVGLARMNQELQRLVERERPDVVLVVLFGNEFRPGLVEALGRHAITVAYMFDDAWRRSYARFWGSRFRFITSPERAGIERYRAGGIDTGVYSPLGYNDELYRPLTLPYQHDVSFVGMWHPYRAWFLSRLRRAGIDAVAYGHGWPAGRVGLERFVEIASASAINLNLPNATSWEPSYLRSTWRALAMNVRHRKNVPQVKARHYELAGCGAFQLSFDAPELAEFFEPGREIVTYSDVDDAVAKIRHYLSQPDERRAVAARALERARAQHTARHRMRDLVEAVLARAGRTA